MGTRAELTLDAYLKSLRRAIPDLALGSLLIQSAEEDGEPYL